MVGLSSSFAIRPRRAAATILAIAYLAALAGFLCLQALGDSGLAPLSYFFTWDMFPSYRSESFRRIAVGETASGKFVRVHPGPIQQCRGGVRGNLTRVELERRGFFYHAAIEQTLKTTVASRRNDPVRHVYLFERYWPAKFNYPPDLYKAWSGREKPNRSYWRLIEEFDVSEARPGDGH